MRIPRANVALLPSLLQSTSLDLAMFGFVYGMRAGLAYGLPGMDESRVVKSCSIETALEAFRKTFGIPEEKFVTGSWKARYREMLGDYHEYLRTKPEPAV